MGVRNPDWYAANATRAYPLDDAATVRDDAGRELPPQILVDCRVRFPVALGRFAYVGAVTVGPQIVTAILMAAPDAARPPLGAAPSVGAGLPLGSVTLPRPVVPNRHYPIQPMAPGVGGWLVFGRGIDEPYSGRFSLPAQSLLLPRVAAAYRPLPIPTLGKLGPEQALTGVVRLLGGTDLEVIQDTRTIDDVEIPAVVIRLVDSLNRNVFDLYKGPCGGRPESRTCDKPALEAINTVSPDCDGNLTIDFRGVQVIEFDGGGGLALDLDLGMADICLGQDYLPDDTGKLPGEYTDACPPVVPPEPPVIPPVPPPLPTSDTCTELPFYDSFDGVIASPWVTRIGEFVIEDDESPGEPFGLEGSPGPAPGRIPGFTGLPPHHRANTTTDVPISNPISKCYASIDQTKRNVAIWNCPTYGPDGYHFPSYVGLTYLTHLRPMPGPQSNGGIVICYDEFVRSYTGDVPDPPRPTYTLWMVNPMTNAVEFYLYNGSSMQLLTKKVAGVGVDQLVVGDWYEMKVVTSIGVGFHNNVDVTVRGITQPAFKEISIPYALSTFTVGNPGTGRPGLGSVNAHCRFSFFSVAFSGWYGPGGTA